MRISTSDLSPDLKQIMEECDRTRIRFTALRFDEPNDLTPVVIFRLGLINFEYISFEELLKLIFLITETLLLNQLTQLTGITAIIDFNEWSYQQIRYIFPSQILPEEYGEALPSSSMLELNSMMFLTEDYLLAETNYSMECSMRR
ncbi:hypothetical protein TNCV_4903711 [Trichonephila clavipes]|uniref:CRAL-TRIO domain-containing protein n=1 Tax=Trichonephila clavipes TaxID=2585209 RepID=A0A8X6VC38_TRICX|nr:hypothetical protein TNCV_4903711 [Trichonephila clavipes]